MTNDTLPPVAPVEGHYAMLRNGMIARPREEQWANRAAFFEGPLHWWGDGKSIDNNENYDIIATISPKIMALAAKVTSPFTSETEAMLFRKQDEEIARLEALIPLADAACDYADQHCRWFDISTAPKDDTFILVKVKDGTPHAGRVFVARITDDQDVKLYPGYGTGIDHLSRWAPLPPSNPPLPAVFTELGAALEKIKGAG